MNFVLPGANVKLLARAVNSFSKIGNELYLEATRGGLELKTINSTNTAYAVVLFQDGFFSSYRQGANDTPEENCCKLSMKPILTIFKGLSKVLTCSVWLDVDQSRLIFQFRCKLEVTKTYRIFLLDSEHINALNLQQQFPSQIVGSHRVFSSVLLHLNNSVVEVAFDLKGDKTVVSNFVEEHDRSTLRSTLAIPTSAFLSYQLNQSANLIFCYKEFKAVTMFAALSKLNITMSFSEAGAPLMLELSKPGVMQAKIVMGTLQPAESRHKRKQKRQPADRAAVHRTASAESSAINSCLTDDITHNTEAAGTDQYSGNSDSVLHRASLREPEKRNGIDSGAVRKSFNQNQSPVAGSSGMLRDVAQTHRQRMINSNSATDSDTLFAGRNCTVNDVRQSDDTVETCDLGEEYNASNSVLSRKRPKPNSPADGAQFPECIPESPEVIEERKRKQAKLRHIFRRCFEPTFDPNMQSGCSRILAPNSDSEEEL
ncbi:cell cycle checkpoint control protein RAD9A isoform X2 [Anopheles aquasalis]|uniref:cell cycle checkpoint control protein RAD9A isoform X2 n=1 Tax=Anopheles aquasalis TaxID=42839 RepID=UPI00215AE235|nr:cell cycle checkpoint control protein RAD9A isoform X2 [Anopheles aquasalis]